MARDQTHFWCLGWRKTISSWDCSVVAARNERTVRTPRSRNNGFGIPTPQRLKYRAAHSCYSLPSSFALATKPSMKLLLSCEDYSNFHKKDKSEKKNSWNPEVYTRISGDQQKQPTSLYGREKMSLRDGHLAQDHTVTEAQVQRYLSLSSPESFLLYYGSDYDMSGKECWSWVPKKRTRIRPSLGQVPSPLDPVFPLSCDRHDACYVTRLLSKAILYICTVQTVEYKYPRWSSHLCASAAKEPNRPANDLSPHRARSPKMGGCQEWENQGSYTSCCDSLGSSLLHSRPVLRVIIPSNCQRQKNLFSHCGIKILSFRLIGPENILDFIFFFASWAVKTT